MLVSADKATSDEWAEQTRINTLGYMQVVMRHYEKTVQRQTKALKGTYEQMLKSATEEAKRIKEERATASERKLRAPPTKRRRIYHDERYDVHVCTPLDKFNQCYETANQDRLGGHLVEDHHLDLLKTEKTDGNKHRPKKQKRQRHILLSVYYTCTPTIPHKPDNIVNLSS